MTHLGTNVLFRLIFPCFNCNRVHVRSCSPHRMAKAEIEWKFTEQNQLIENSPFQILNIPWIMDGSPYPIAWVLSPMPFAWRLNATKMASMAFNVINVFRMVDGLRSYAMKTHRRMGVCVRITDAACGKWFVYSIRIPSSLHYYFFRSTQTWPPSSSSSSSAHLNRSSHTKLMSAGSFVPTVDAQAKPIGPHVVMKMSIAA